MQILFYKNDDRRWIAGFAHTQHEQSQNLHNHNITDNNGHIGSGALISVNCTVITLLTLLCIINHEIS